MRLIEELLARSAVYQALSVLLRHPTTWQGSTVGGAVAPPAEHPPSSCDPAVGGAARWWDHPDADTTKWLASQEHRRLIEVVEILKKEDAGPLPEAIRRLVMALDAVSIPEWIQEHERIFGHSVQSAAPPYELEYGEAHSHRQPQELGDIAAFYQAFGLQASRAAHERVDSIVAECDFLHALLYKQACALDEDHEEHAEVCQAAARQFLADHLGRWGPAFCLQLSQAAGPEGILAAIAEAALAWLVQDCARVGVPAGSRDLPLRSPKERDEVGCAACALQEPVGR